MTPRTPLHLVCGTAPLALALAVALFGCAALAAGTPRPPIAAVKPVTSEYHGVRRTDEYAWLRTGKLEAVLAHPEALEAPIRAHLDAERRYAESVLAPNRELERQLLQEMTGRISPRDQSVPEAKGPWQYYTRYADGAQRKLHCRRPRGGGREEILLDENALAGGQRDFALGETSISPDHRLLAYSIDADGSERSTLKIRMLDGGRDLDDTIPEVRGSVVWSRDGGWLFYVRRDPSKWGREVYRHKLGTAVEKDALVYAEREEGFALSLRVTLSDRFLLIEAADFSTSEVRLVDLDDPTSAPRAVMSRQPGVKFVAADRGD